MMGMTASDCSTALRKAPFAFATDLERDCELKALGTSAGGGNICPDVRKGVEGEEEDAPNFETLPQVGWSFSTESEVFRFTLRDFRYGVSTRAKSSPLVGLLAKGPTGETFIVEGGEGLKTAERADLELEGPGISDLISSAYGHGGHSANACAMTLSSGLRSGRTPERHLGNAELEISNDLIKIIPKTKRHSRRFLGGGLSNRNAQGVVLVKRVILPIAAANKEVMFLPKPVRGGKIRNHQGSASTPGKIEEALGVFLHAKKIKEQSYTGNTEPSVPKENQ